MKFPYVRYEIEPTQTIPSGEVRRPLIPIRLIGRNGSVEAFGLLDTGADNVFVSASLADLLGIDRGDEAELALGAAGHEIRVFPGAIEIEVTQNGTSYRWRAQAGFLLGDDDPPIAYLGHAGFLEYFHATFDGDAQIVELIPNNRLESLT